MALKARNLHFGSNELICQAIVGNPSAYVGNAATGWHMLKIWPLKNSGMLLFRHVGYMGYENVDNVVQQQESHMFALLNTVICLNSFSIWIYISYSLNIFGMVKSQMWAKAANKQASNSSNALPRNGIAHWKALMLGICKRSAKDWNAN